MKIKILWHNWYQRKDNDEFAGQDYEKFQIGEGGVIKIIEHMACGEGDKWYYDIFYENGNISRLFNPNSVEFVKENN